MVREIVNRPTFAALMRGEGIRLLSVPFPRWIAVAQLVLAAVAAAVIASIIPITPSNPEATLEIIARLFELVAWIAILCTTLACGNAIGGEITSGAIRAAILAAPRRGRLLCAKSVVLFLTALLSAAATTTGSLAIALPVLAAREAPITWSFAIPIAIAAVGLCTSIATIGLIAFATTIVFRSAAGAVLVVLAVVFIAPSVTAMLANELDAPWLSGALPSVAAHALIMPALVDGPWRALDGTMPSSVPWHGAVVLTAWLALSLLGAGRALAGPIDIARSSPPRSLARGTGDGRAPVGTEWIKLRTLPSTRWIAAGTIAVLVGYGAFRAIAVDLEEVASDLELASRIEYVYAITAGIGLAQLVLGGLAATSVTAEHRFGTIRTTLAATPRRTIVSLRKVAAVAGATAVIALAGLALSWGVVSIIRAIRGTALGITWPLGLASVACGTAYLVLVALLALGIGGLVRHAAGAVTALVALLVVLPSLFNVVLAFARGTPAVWIGNLGAFLPWAGERAYMDVLLGLEGRVFGFAQDGALSLPPAIGGLVLLAWVALALAAWIATFERRAV